MQFNFEGTTYTIYRDKPDLNTIVEREILGQGKGFAKGKDSHAGRTTFHKDLPSALRSIVKEGCGAIGDVPAGRVIVELDRIADRFEDIVGLLARYEH